MIKLTVGQTGVIATTAKVTATASAQSTDFITIVPGSYKASDGTVCNATNFTLTSGRGQTNFLCLSSNKLQLGVLRCQNGAYLSEPASNVVSTNWPMPRPIAGVLLPLEMVEWPRVAILMRAMWSGPKQTAIKLYCQLLTRQLRFSVVERW